MDHEWDRRQKSVLACNEFMFDHKIACDVTFLIQYPPDLRTATRISAHKFVLYSRSPVFFAMFSGTVLSQSGDIEIDDVSVDAFTELLR